MKDAISGQSSDERLDRRIYVLAIGRFISMIGTGFTTFYAPVFFVKSVGISATLVGLGLAANSAAGSIARILGGSLSDSEKFGRSKTLLISSLTLTLASVLMGCVKEFNLFLAANALLGFGIGLYWPAAEAMIADLSNEKNRHHAYALNRFADYGGLGIGVVFAGLLVQFSGAFRLLFFADAVSYLILSLAIFLGIKESEHRGQSANLISSWLKALRDPCLQKYAFANVLMTNYIVQISSSIPLYLSEQVRFGSQKALSPVLLSSLFAVHVGIVALCQMPLSKALAKLKSAQSLLLSALIWGIAFLCLSACGKENSNLQFALAALSLVIMSIASVVYGPPSSALIVEMAPLESRAIYFSINSLCWALGGILGPPLVLSAMDKFPTKMSEIWLLMAASTLIPASIFQNLKKRTQNQD
ncbi:MAG: MFS transporter [Candidatus Obscuribacterales bacterium]|nr:MFS transporter [Candidatus Obscuribacterales bacterium]